MLHLLKVMKMKNWFGFLLKYYRLKNNFSQEGICKGICTVSYLSKIENGTALPSQEIIEQLFAVLGIVTCWDEEKLKDAEKLIHVYFDKVFHMEDVTHIAKHINTYKELFEISPLYLRFQLFKIQEASQQQPEQLPHLFEQIKPFISYMNEKEKVLYELLYGEIYDDEAAFLRADAYSPCSFSKLKLAHFYYKNGQFQKALQYCSKAYDLAAYEGNIAVMSEVSFIEGGCYCNLHQIDLMLQTYHRCMNLNRNNESIQSNIYYNIGASYLEVEDYQKALEYLKLAKQTQTDMLDKFLTYHKLSLTYFNLNQMSESLIYIDKAETILKQGLIHDGNEDIYAKMIKVVRLMNQNQTDDDYMHLLKEVYEECGSRIIFGFQQFHGHMLIKAYMANRRYKEALNLTQQMQKKLQNM